jgi:hypothetical protein
VIYTSNIVHFDTLPQVGIFANRNALYELRLTNVGLNTLLPLTVGDTYCLDIRDVGTTGGAVCWASNQPSSYPNGGSFGCARIDPSPLTFSGPSSVDDLAFSVTMVPESSGLGIACPLAITLAVLIHRTRRHREVVAVCAQLPTRTQKRG